MIADAPDVSKQKLKTNTLKNQNQNIIFHRGMQYMKSWKEWHDSLTKSNNNSGIGVAIFRVSHDKGEDEQTLRFGWYQGMTEGNS